MVYDPSTDFVGLWRAILGGVEKAEMPGLDFVVAALGRAGLIRVVFSEVPPTVDQAKTAWFKTAHPSYAAEGALYLWDERLGTYVPATPELFFIYYISYTENDLLAIFAVIGAPTDDIGKDGDYAIRLDAPGGIYGPKAGGHWPTEPLPGTSYSQISHFLDWLGNVQGELVFRNSASWDVLQPASTPNQVLKSGGAGANPFWSSAVVTSPDLDGLFGGVQGSIIYRGLSLWTSLPPTTNGFVLTTHGSNANPSWTALSTVIDLAFPGAPQGSIIYRNPTQWTFLPPGTAEQVLATMGAGANPVWSTKVGPPGPTGATGATGGPGPAGPAGPPGPTGGGGTIIDARLAYAGYSGGCFPGTGNCDPFPGGVMVGWMDEATSGVVGTRFRYLQLQVVSGAYYTVAYTG